MARGSIRPRQGKKGVSYEVRVEYAADPITGKRRQETMTCKTKKEAERELNRLLVEVEDGTAIDRTKVTVADFLYHWLETVAKHNIRPTTYRSYEQLMRVHIVPALGSVLLQRLTPAQVQAFYTQKLTEPRGDGKAGILSPRTVRYLHAVLREALQQAVKWGMVSRNVCDATDPPRAVRPQIKTWDSEQMAAFLAVAKVDTYAAAWILALTTGMRRGEVLGIRWQDIDFARNVLHVRQSLVEVGAALHFHEPKTASGRRAVALTPGCMAALKEHRISQNEQRLQIGPAWRDNDLVFTVRDGGPLAPRNFIRRYSTLVKEAGVPMHPFHSVRHAHATALLRDGVNLKIVSARLGHSGIQITADTYLHVTSDMQESAIGNVDAALFG